MSTLYVVWEALKKVPYWVYLMCSLVVAFAVVQVRNKRISEEKLRLQRKLTQTEAKRSEALRESRTLSEAKKEQINREFDREVDEISKKTDELTRKMEEDPRAIADGWLDYMRTKNAKK